MISRHNLHSSSGGGEDANCRLNTLYLAAKSLSVDTKSVENAPVTRGNRSQTTHLPLLSPASCLRTPVTPPSACTLPLLPTSAATVTPARFGVVDSQSTVSEYEGWHCASLLCSDMVYSPGPSVSHEVSAMSFTRRPPPPLPSLSSPAIAGHPVYVNLSRARSHTRSAVSSSMVSTQYGSTEMHVRSENSWLNDLTKYSDPTYAPDYLLPYPTHQLPSPIGAMYSDSPTLDPSIPRLPPTSPPPPPPPLFQQQQQRQPQQQLQRPMLPTISSQAVKPHIPANPHRYPPMSLPPSSPPFTQVPLVSIQNTIRRIVKLHIPRTFINPNHAALQPPALLASSSSGYVSSVSPTLPLSPSNIPAVTNPSFTPIPPSSKTATELTSVQQLVDNNNNSSSSNGGGNMYKPAAMRGTGDQKEGKCPICAANGEERWLRTKISAYWYHLNYTHGISSFTGQPYNDPIEIRTRENTAVVSNVSTNGGGSSGGKKGYNGRQLTELRDGLCGVCNEWIKMDSSKGIAVAVPQMFWWKHCQACHNQSAKLTMESEPNQQHQVKSKSTKKSPVKGTNRCEQRQAIKRFKSESRTTETSSDISSSDRMHDCAESESSGSDRTYAPNHH